MPGVRLLEGDARMAYDAWANAPPGPPPPPPRPPPPPPPPPPPAPTLPPALTPAPNALAAPPPRAPQDEGLRFLSSKAEIIDELEATLPSWIKPRAWFPPFVHILKFHPDRCTGRPGRPGRLPSPILNYSMRRRCARLRGRACVRGRARLRGRACVRALKLPPRPCRKSRQQSPRRRPRDGPPPSVRWPAAVPPAAKQPPACTSHPANCPRPRPLQHLRGQPQQPVERYRAHGDKSPQRTGGREGGMG
jgi:hypothetical protein